MARFVRLKLKLQRRCLWHFKDGRFHESSLASKLNGLEIVEGTIHLKASDNAILKAIVAPTGEYVWQFREQIGKAEIWMQCVYKGTQVRLFRRVDPSVKVCREKRIQGKRRDGNSVVQSGVPLRAQTIKGG